MASQHCRCSCINRTPPTQQEILRPEALRCVEELSALFSSDPDAEGKTSAASLALTHLVFLRISSTSCLM